MDKRKLSKMPRIQATEEMCNAAKRLGSIEHIVTASLNEDVVQMNFYRVANLLAGQKEAEFRTFLSKDDYITQDLSTEKTKWLTSSFINMHNFAAMKHEWNNETHSGTWRTNAYIYRDEDFNILDKFFEDFKKTSDEYEPWSAIYRFQEWVLDNRLEAKHKKVTDIIDKRMEPIKEPAKEFYDWVWKEGMSFSRYLIYKGVGRDKAVCECTHCGHTDLVDRKAIRLRNNEKGICPFCGSKVIIKAKGVMPYRTNDERWFLYVDPQEEGFLLRYFHAYRHIKNDKSIEICLDKCRIEEYINEYSRCFYKFNDDGKIITESYEWGVYKQRGQSRWCPDVGNIACMECILYPGNLPTAWENTPMKYSALEVLASNIPTVALRYEDAIKKYLKFPKLEWICKMGLNRLAKNIISGMNYYGSLVGKIDYDGKTIYEILGLTKINTKILQEIDGDHYVLRLLQVSQTIGMQFKADQLKEYYETFECNTELLKQANRKVSLHKLVKYIEKESQSYPIGERHNCWNYSYMRYKERTDPRIERKQNMANDWLEYLEWCKELNYDLDNKFFYMPNNFKKVHDRTYEEYQALLDKKAAEEKVRKEKQAKRRMEKIKKAMEDIFKKNEGVDAFSITGKGLILKVPQSADEIRSEGAALHHCVATYVNKVAEGKTMILFIRKAKEPDKSYYTMEWNGEKIVQCRGFKNCDMTPDVKAFTKVFEEKMKKKLESNNLRRCG